MTQRYLSIVMLFLFNHYFLIFQTMASETDPYLAFGKQIDDSSKILNKHFNKIITRTILLRGLSIESCSKLTFRIGLSFSYKGTSRTEEFAQNSSLVDSYPKKRYTIKNYKRHSIYRRFAIHRLSRTINVGGHYIGTDKLSHFFGMGFIYWIYYQKIFSRYHKNTRSLDQAHNKALKQTLLLGITSEKGPLGLKTSGVFSFADLEANYQGLRFFLSLCDPLNPRIVKNKSKKWQLIRPLNMNEYVNSHWDELVNHNYYPRRKWPKIKFYLKNYCSLLENEEYKLRIERYKKIKSSLVQDIIQTLEQKKQFRYKSINPLERICY